MAYRHRKPDRRILDRRVVADLFFHYRHAPHTAVSIHLSILGGFTTFSTLALDTTRLLSAGDALRAAIYLAISLAGGIAACIIGIWAAKTILT